MSEPRTFASLSPSLLARKGSAKPAMRRQDNASFGMSGMRAEPAPIDDLGWNDWGAPEQAATTPVVAAVETPAPEAMPAPVIVADAIPFEQQVLEEDASEADQLDEMQATVGQWAAEGQWADEEGEDGSTDAPMASLSPEMPAFAPRKPDVLRQIENLAERINRTAAPVRAMVPEGRRAAFTLRLDAERHFRLKMAGVLLNRSAQTIVTEALDKYLAEFADVSGPGRMAAKRS
ncbi:hypothetical protein WBP07_09635 [Novosphingobium sp. BL-8A]|uniref:hypothetical protein n=1 Tax=Novosphingobium sp. BL-8A TaxID=3127639 RepID=UPI00375699C9